MAAAVPTGALAAGRERRRRDSRRSRRAQHQVKRGLAWKAVSTVALQGLRLVTAITLAHLLTPHQYGVAGMVLVFASLILVFSDLAFGSALIHRESLSEADRSTVFWTSTGVGLLLTLVGIAMSWPLAAFYNEPAVSRCARRSRSASWSRRPPRRRPRCSCAT